MKWVVGRMKQVVDRRIQAVGTVMATFGKVDQVVDDISLGQKR